VKELAAATIGFLAAAAVPAAIEALLFPIGGYDPVSVMGTFLIVYYFSFASYWF
jgi:hypothetical protein